MFILFAHAGESHETATEAAAHTASTDWYVTLILFFTLLAGVAKLTYHLSGKSLPITVAILQAVLFVSGVAAYQLSPAISVFALSTGFALVLFQVVAGLSASGKRRH